MKEDDDEAALDRLADLQDELEEIVKAAGERDGDKYLNDLKIRVRKVEGRYYLSLRWYRQDCPSSSTIYAPHGTWIGKWYRSIDRDGLRIWESGLEVIFNE